MRKPIVSLVAILSTSLIAGSMSFASPVIHNSKLNGVESTYSSVVYSNVQLAEHSFIYPALSIRGSAVTFKDVTDTSWYMNDLTYIMNDGRQIIQGYPDGTFKPETNLTVEQFIKALVVGCYFTTMEVNTKDWSLPYRNKAVELGILKPGDFTNYKKNITREEMAMLAVRTSDYLKKSPQSRELAKIETLIKDSGTITTAKKDAVLKAFDMGILLGYPDGNYKPKNSLKRSEAVAVIRRVIDESNRKIPDLTNVEAQPADTIVVEGIKFSPSRDLEVGHDSSRDGAMKFDKAEEFINKFLTSIIFTSESGKYYVSGYLPNLPAGQSWQASIIIFYGDNDEVTYSSFDSFATTESYSNYGRFYGGKTFKFQLQGGPNNLNKTGIHIGCQIINSSLGWDGRVNLWYPKKEYQQYTMTNSYTKEFNWDGMFKW